MKDVADSWKANWLRHTEETHISPTHKLYPPTTTLNIGVLKLEQKIIRQCLEELMIKEGEKQQPWDASIWSWTNQAWTLWQLRRFQFYHQQTKFKQGQKQRPGIDKKIQGRWMINWRRHQMIQHHDEQTKQRAWDGSHKDHTDCKAKDEHFQAADKMSIFKAGMSTSASRLMSLDEFWLWISSKESSTKIKLNVQL